MAYENEHIAALLKEARENKGLSQRELAKRSGVPQSHISKIEAGAVDLRVSSLSALARALDLELVLVPRKAMPAVNSIVRSTSVRNLSNGHGKMPEQSESQSSRPAYSLDDDEEDNDA